LRVASSVIAVVSVKPGQERDQRADRDHRRRDAVDQRARGLGQEGRDEAADQLDRAPGVSAPAHDQDQAADHQADRGRRPDVAPAAAEEHRDRRRGQRVGRGLGGPAPGRRRGDDGLDLVQRLLRVDLAGHDRVGQGVELGQLAQIELGGVDPHERALEVGRVAEPDRQRGRGRHDLGAQAEPLAHQGQGLLEAVSRGAVGVERPTEGEHEPDAGALDALALGQGELVGGGGPADAVGGVGAVSHGPRNTRGARPVVDLRRARAGSGRPSTPAARIQCNDPLECNDPYVAAVSRVAPSRVAPSGRFSQHPSCRPPPNPPPPPKTEPRRPNPKSQRPSGICRGPPTNQRKH
jgi:hypothetical protein